MAVILRYFTEFDNLEDTNINTVKVQLILGNNLVFGST